MIAKLVEDAEGTAKERRPYRMSPGKVMRMKQFSIRPLAADDGEVAGAIFFDAVHCGAAGHYTSSEIAAWAGAAPNTSRWKTRLVGVEGFMAEYHGKPIGFMTIDRGGCIDLAFVKYDYLGQGAGWRLYQAVEDYAMQLAIGELTTEASKVAKPFFERQGWTVEREQVVMKSGTPLTNFKMSKRLLGDPSKRTCSA